MCYTDKCPVKFSFWPVDDRKQKTLPIFIPLIIFGLTWLGNKLQIKHSKSTYKGKGPTYTNSLPIHMILIGVEIIIKTDAILEYVGKG